MAPKKARPMRHREMPRPRNDRPRNDVIDVPAPILEPPSSMALVRYSPPGGLARSAPAPKPRPSRVAGAAKAVATAVRPTVAGDLLDKTRLAGIAANAGGAVAASVAANQLGDDLAPKPLGMGITLVGALGSVFLADHWQKIAQGMLGAGMGQVATAYLAERQATKAAKEAARRVELERAVVAAAVRAAPPPALPAPAPAPAAPRNAFEPFDLTPAYAAADQAHAEIGAQLDGRNGWDGPDLRTAWGYGGDADPYAAG